MVVHTRFNWYRGATAKRVWSRTIYRLASMHQRANEVEPALVVRGENNVSESDGKELRTWCLSTSGPGLQRVWVAVDARVTPQHGRERSAARVCEKR